jgi:hypothetical protein
MSQIAQRFLALFGALLLCQHQTEAERFSSNLGQLAVLFDQAEAPNCQALSVLAQKLLDSMNEQADLAEQQLFGALEDLDAFDFTVGGENTTMANASSNDATDDLLVASQDASAAAEAKEKVDRMVELCTILSSEVATFKIDSEDHAVLKRQNNAASLSRIINQLKDEMVTAEQRDLGNLIALLQGILEDKMEVEKLDAKVGAGAIAGIQQATDLVVGYVEQLQERQGSLTSADAFADVPALQPEGGKLEIDKATSSSLEVVFKKIVAIIAAKDTAYKAGLAKVSVLRKSGKASNATAIKASIQAVKAEGYAKARAIALNNAIEKTTQSINAFFAMLGGYESKQVQKRMAGEATVEQLESQADDLLKEIDGSVLADAEKFFKLYAIMWLRASEAEDYLTHDNPAFGDVLAQVKVTAVAVHEWLNEELHSLCDYHGSCSKVRSLIFAEAEKKMNYCDERFTEYRCTGEQSGYGPNGRSCKWVTPDMKAGEARKLGLRGRCKSLRPPTAGLKYHQDHPDGAGIFY